MAETKEETAETKIMTIQLNNVLDKFVSSSEGHSVKCTTEELTKWRRK